MSYLDLNLKEASLFEVYQSKTYSNTYTALQIALEKIELRLLRTKGEWTKAKLNEIKKAIKDEIDGAYSGVFDSISKESVDASQIIAKAYASYSLPKSTIDEITNSRRLIQGYEFKQLFELTRDNHVRQLQVLIGAGVAEGKTSKQLASEISIKNTKLSKGQIRTNIFTTIGEARAIARHKSYEKLESDGAIDGYVYDATLDSNTTQYCREHDQRVYKKSISEIAHLIQVHFNCRSVFRPLTPDETNLTRASQTGTVQNQSYEQWFLSQDKDFQRATLSNRKYSEFLKGKYKVKSLADLDGKTDLKQIKTLLTAKKSIPDIKFGYDGKFDGYVKDIRDEAKIVIDKLPKPYEIKDKGAQRSSYYMPSKRLVDGKSGSLISRAEHGKDTFIHEYGHHIDYNIMENSNNGSFLMQRSMGKDFLEARTKDIAHLKDKFKGKKMFEELSSKWKGKEEFNGASDIFDSMSLGIFRDRYGMSGHGSRYYNAKSGKARTNNKSNQQTEVFAQLFEAYSNGGVKWKNILEHFPNQAEVFENAIKDFING